jgi:site-specific DNA recombinase
MKANKAVAYLRVSTKDQSDKGYSLPTQLQDIEAYAVRSGLEITEVIQEDASGQILDRPGLSKARELLRTGKVQALIAHDSDRVSRIPEHYVLLRAEWEKSGVSLHYALRGEVDLDDFSHQLMEDMNGRFANKWLKKMIEATRRGKRGKVATGKVIVAQRPPYGYIFKDGQLIIKEDEAKIIRLIFKLYIQDGYSIRRIAEYLTEQNIPSPADTRPHIRKIRAFGVWAKVTIETILKRETYAGVWYWGKTRREVVRVVNGKKKLKITQAPPGDWIAVEVPAIIDQATFQAAQKRLRYNIKMSTRNTQREYLMSKRLTCGRCGCAVYAEGKSGKGGYVWLYYRCASKNVGHTTPNCGAPYFRHTDIDDGVWFFVTELLKEPEMMIRLLEENQQQAQFGKVDIATEITQTQEAIKKKNAALVKLIRLESENEDEQQAEAFEKTRNEMGQELARLQDKLQALKDELGLIPTQEDIALITELITQFSQQKEYEEAIQSDKVPFEIKQGWVEVLNITGVLFDEGDKRRVKLNCRLGEWALLLGTVPPRKHSLNLQFSHTILLPNGRTKIPLYKGDNQQDEGI